MNTTTSAQLEIQPPDEALTSLHADTALAAAAPFALQQEAAQRIAAHRSRKVRSTPLAAGDPTLPPRERSARIAAAVAERYAHSQSYRAFLAEEAERAIHQAEAAAEVAHRSATAVSQAQQQLLAELEAWNPQPINPQPIDGRPIDEPAASTPASTPRIATGQAPARAHFSAAELTVRLYEEVGRLPAPRPQPSAEPMDPDEALALDEEIAFRQAPVFAEPAEPPVPLPANLIEFPRQLVAARKARPRLAEGPLRDEADHAPSSAQLRIFEVQAAQISTAPAVESATPEWSTIRLDATAATPHTIVAETLFSPALAPQTAPLSRRFMAAAVDLCLVAVVTAAFTAAFASTTAKLAGGSFIGTQIPATRVLLAAAAIALPVFALFFYFLFFSFADATPGMRYARIGLCTFSDENPSRSAMRRRLFAILIAACPLGIGFLWALVDDDHLGWHDRISRMYQRSY